MYTRIKELADSAVALQNKINMEAALREISGICDMELNPLADGVVHDYQAPEGNPVVLDAKTDSQYDAIGEAHTKELGESMQQTRASFVRDTETLAAVDAGKATLLTKKQKAAKK